jgi:hypothetical protein
MIKIPGFDNGVSNSTTPGVKNARIEMKIKRKIRKK